MQTKNPQPSGINYVYFGFAFALLIFLSTCSVFMKENLAGSRIFFLFYSIGQASIETLFFAFALLPIHRFIGKIGYWFFIGLTFLCYVAHLVDFMIDRILDSSVLQTLLFLFDESFDNFLNLLEASGIALWAWLAFFMFIATLPLIGMAVYKATDWIAQKKPLFLPRETFFQLFICIPTALFFWDFSASKVIHPDAYTAFVKSLPWKQTFLRPKNVEWQSGPLSPHQSEMDIQQSILSVHPSKNKKPSIFLFIVESLREDCITDQIAPHLARFRDENIRAHLSLSNANGTQLSWFSIFHSQFPFFWNQLQKEGWKMGSPALALFKQLGYKIRVYSSAHLGYYRMDELIFGKDRYLVDSFQTFHAPPKYACDADREAIQALKKDLSADLSLQEGHLCVVFLDSTHFDYSWPKDHPPKFIPFGSEISYFWAYQSKKNIELIKNRYRNAVHYIDTLFGDVLNVAPSDALIAFTGDHGEEFFERGHLFHNSHLIHEQTNVPIYLKINGISEKIPLMSQMDIMPTLLDGAAGILSEALEGESVLREKQWPFAAIARFNASRSPYEFCLHNGKHKIIAQFLDRKKIFESTALQILSLRTYKDERLTDDKQIFDSWIDQEFGPAFKRLFSKTINK